MRIAVKFKRVGLAKYISHLDMQRLFSRALRRTGLPLKYSSGFNPHINLSFASALAVGMESIGEYAEFQTVIPVNLNKIADVLGPVLPEGFEITTCGELAENAKKLMAATAAAGYVITPGKNAELFFREVNDVISRDEFIVQKKKENKIRQLDIRPLIYSCTLSDEKKSIRMELALSGEKSLSPVFLLEVLENKANASFDASIVRTEIYMDLDAKLLPLDHMFTQKTGDIPLNKD